MTEPVNPALKTWQKKLDYLQQQEAIASDPSKKFSLQEEIEECHQKIAELTDNSPVTILNNLPYGTDHFVGRDEKLEELHDRLQRETRLAICAVAGMGGIGKTEIALQYALRYEGEYNGGICWVNARGGDIGIQVINFASPLLTRPIPDKSDLPQQIQHCWNYWREGKVLLIYDDIEDYSLVTSYLPPQNRTRFQLLMTGRVRPNPALLPVVDLPALDKESALTLLRKLIGEEEKPLEERRIDAEIDKARELCEWLGYLPLGLELAGAYLAESADLSLAEFWEELQDERLETEALQGMARELKTLPSLLKVFQISWDYLGKNAPESRSLALRLSLFAPAPIAWEWVESLYPPKEKRVIRRQRDSALVKFSLLQRVDANIYELHPLLREFFFLQLENDERAGEYKSTFCRVMVDIANRTPQTVTRKDITDLTPAIPHLKEVATRFMNWVVDDDILRPNTALGGWYEGKIDYIEAEKWYKRSIEVTRERFKEDDLNVATSYENLALLYVLKGWNSEAEALHKKALVIRVECLGEHHLDTGNSFNYLAELYHMAGRFSEAKPLFQQTLASRIEQVGENHLDVATIYDNLAKLYCSTGEYEEAENLYYKSLNIRLELSREHDCIVAHSYNNLATLYLLIGEFIEAENLCLEALSIYLNNLEEYHPSVITTCHNLSTVYYTTGRYREAEEVCKKALDLSIKHLGDRHKDLTRIYNNLGKVYRRQGRYTEARFLYQQALSVQLETLGENHPDTATFYNDLAVVCQLLGDFFEAESLWKRTLKIQVDTLDDNHPNMAKTYSNLAGLYSSKKRYKKAEAMYKKAIKIRLDKLGANHPDLATSYNNLALLYQSTGRYIEAEQLYDQALTIRLEKLEYCNPDVATSYHNLAYLYQLTGRYREAIAYYEQALEIALNSLEENHPKTVAFYNNYLTMLRETPIEDILADLPAESRKSFLQWWKSFLEGEE